MARLSSLLILIGLVVCGPGRADFLLPGPITRTIAGSAAATYLINQNFEGTGYDNSETWSETGTPNEDYTTSPAPLHGSQSCFIDGTDPANQRIDSPTFAATSDVWLYFLYNPTSFTGSGTAYLAQIRAGSTVVAAVTLHSTGVVRLETSVNSAFTTDAMSTGTTYHVWVHYVKGSGSNAQSSVGFSTDGTRPTSGNKFTSYSNGTETADADNVRFMEEGGSNARAIIDKVRVDDATIGDNPS